MEASETSGLPFDPDPVTPSPDAEPVKKKKGKKRPSDFEIVRTILTRTNERKLPYLMKNNGEDPDLIFLSSQKEDGFCFGSAEISIMLIEITDPDLKTITQSVFSKMHGMDDADHQMIINLRDQISELAKTKGESIDVETSSNEHGSVWTTKTNVNNDSKVVYFVEAIDSLFHVECAVRWCKQYRPFLTSQANSHLYYPYTHPETVTGSMITLPPSDDPTHPITRMFPHGFRFMGSKGLDVMMTKCLNEFPYPVKHQELMVVQQESSAVQIIHRIVAEGWNGILLRPNAILFPTVDVELPPNESNHPL